MIEVKTILSAQLMRKYNRTQAMKRIWIAFALMVVLIGIGIACLFDKDLGMPFSVPVIIVGVSLPVLYVIFTRAMIERALKNSPLIKNETTQIFRFASDRMMANESSKYVTAQDTQISYDAILKAEEREEAFYLFIGKTQAYILDAKGFTMGSRRELHFFLLDKLGNKKFKYLKRLYAAK